MKKTDQPKRRNLLTCLQLILLLVIAGSMHAQQRTWMLPYYNNTSGVNRVPIINFKNSPPTFESHYIGGGSFSTQAVGNGEYCNNCATDQLTRISQFFISGRHANNYQSSTLKTLYTKWEQICGDTVRVDTFTTVGHADLAHESLNEVAIGDGETPGTFWVVMQQSPANIDGFGPGFYVYLMDMNNSTLNSSIIINLNSTNYSALPVFSGTSTDGTTGLGEGVALGPKFQYVMAPGESIGALIALNGKMCRSIYIANYNKVYHFLIDLALNTVIYSDTFTLTGTNLSSGNMFMELDLNFPQNGDHPTMLGLTGWGGVFAVNTSSDHGKMTAQTAVNDSTGGYGLEFDRLGNYMYYSLHGYGAAPKLRKWNCTAGGSSAVPFTSGSLTGTQAHYNLCLESALDGNIYGLTTNQEMVSIINPELLTPTAVTAVGLTAASFPGLSTGSFGLSLPDWVDGEVPLSSGGGSIVVKLPCGLCDQATISHTVDIYATDANGNSTLVQHFDMFPCEEITLNVCPGIIYDVVFDEGLPNEQHSLEQIAFPGDVHTVSFTIPNTSTGYYTYMTNTTITTNTLWDNKVYIGPNVIVTVPAGVTLDITNVDVLFGSDAGIDFKNGAVLRANNSVFRPCQINDVWRSLAFYNSASGDPMPSGMINECTFKNAKTAIEAIGTTTPSLKTLDLRITNNLFADCQRGIGLNLIDFKRSITGNTYMLENKSLPFSTINTGSVNPPKTMPPSLNQNDYHGIFGVSVTFHDLISQNDFVMTSDSTVNDQMSYGISLQNAVPPSLIPTNPSTPTINSNKITDFSYGISTSGINKLSVENNTLEWTNLYKKVIKNQYKFHIYVNYGENILIKNNKIYSANLINQNAATSVYDNNAGSGPFTPQYKSVGITTNFCNNVSVKQNEITGVESGIVAIGGKINNVQTRNIFIAENEIKKSWYYGIYTRTNENIDIACNVIDMEAKSGKDATGIGYFNTPLSPNNWVYPTYVSFRSNCIFNTKNAIYCYNQNTTTTYVPRIYNNFCYNYTRVGFENNGFSRYNMSSPQDLYHNTFISNNASSGLPDVLSDVGHTLFADYNYGVVIGSTTISTAFANTASSTASCAMQVSTYSYPNTMDATQTCEYFFPSQSAGWNPAGKLIDWPSTGQDFGTSSTEAVELNDPVYGEMGELIRFDQEVFDMYPVPATSNLSITYNLEKAENAYIEFIDIQGRVLKTVALEAEHTTVNVNVSEFTPGLYIVRLTNSDKGVYYSKMVKQ